MEPEDEEALRHRLFDAVQLYRERFQEVLPTLDIPIPEGRLPDLIAAMRRAVDTGQPLTAAEVSRIAGPELPRGGSAAGG